MIIRSAGAIYTFGTGLWVPGWARPGFRHGLHPCFFPRLNLHDIREVFYTERIHTY
ncbi:hypothetical protein CENSYa_0551 [Cenarchaeum symbiosum A]|uniref:Uncharacterized protein n=1 Tax=Cenarchaeum symbiosum (strain A) TaxID=414004 RepID=A0RV17_CENSY|nr:hypothetical protein CENSYa_0551 [Cenarchaeum symbiosum A]